MPPKKQKEELPIGTRMWTTRENWHGYKEKKGPFLEIIVVECELISIGKYLEFRQFEPALNNLYYFKPEEIGKKIFFAPKEAALRAKEVTEKHDRTWAFTGEPPMRRTWEKYLKE